MDDSVFTEEMKNIELIDIENGDLNNVYEMFKQNVADAIEKSVPKFRPKPKKVAPWSNKTVSKLSDKKRRLWNRYKCTGLQSDYEGYQQVLRIFNEKKNEAIVAYEMKIINNKNNNYKRYCRYVSKKQRYGKQSIILKDGIDTITDEKKCAEIMNNYFTSVFTSGQSNTGVSMSHIPLCPEIPMINISSSDVQKIIDDIDISKSTGPDAIPGFLIKKFSFIFVPILTVIFQRSYDEGFVPLSMKEANITPLHKGGEKTAPENYRPVSLTPVIAKLLEKII